MAPWEAATRARSTAVVVARAAGGGGGRARSAPVRARVDDVERARARAARADLGEREATPPPRGRSAPPRELLCSDPVMSCCRRRPSRLVLAGHGGVA